MDLKTFELFREWLPVRGYWQENRALIDWCFVGKERLTKPFFDNSIEIRFREPFNLLFRHQTPIEFLGELHDFSEGLKPTGFIFHLSRCGSTLVAQMLAALERNVVISEASPIDFVLRAKNVAEDERVRWLRWMIGALGQKRNAADENYFVKFDSWHALELHLIKRAFPDVPWIFLYRNPVEVIVSQMRQRGAYMIPGVVKDVSSDLTFEESIRLSGEEYCARMLASICRSVREPLKNGEGLAINYTQLPDIVNPVVLEHFGVELTGEELEKMFAATKVHAKNPSMSFTADSESKQREASAKALEAAEKYVNPLYEEIEAIRESSPAD